MNEIKWKPIKGFDGYYINKEGQVKSTRSYKSTKEKILKGSSNQQGYKTINLIKDSFFSNNKSDIGAIYTTNLITEINNTLC